MQIAGYGGNFGQVRDSSNIALHWLLRLRWWVIACQSLLVAALVLLFDMIVPVVVLGVVIGFQVAGNLFFHSLVRRDRGLSETAFTVVLVTDTLLLTVLLYTTGGPMNPFTFLYLVHIALASILMRPVRAAQLAAVACLAYLTLFVLPPYHHLAGPDRFPLASLLVGDCAHEMAGGVPSGHGFSLHLQGMWVAFAVTAFFIVFFVGQVHEALAAHRRTLSDLRNKKIETKNWRHWQPWPPVPPMNSTPLGTIAVASKEMQLMLKHEPSDGLTVDLLEDLQLIRAQVDHCKEIIYQMAADAASIWEKMVRFPLVKAIEQTLAGFTPEQRARIRLHDRAGELTVRMPFRTLCRVLGGLVKNAFDASPADGMVDLEWSTADGFLMFTVRDQGTGMAEETRQRVAEPFFTTKAPGRGLGLGLFLARTAAERFGGGLTIESAPNRGSTVHLNFALKIIQG